MTIRYPIPARQDVATNRITNTTTFSQPWRTTDTIVVYVKQTIIATKPEINDRHQRMRYENAKMELNICLSVTNVLSHYRWLRQSSRWNTILLSNSTPFPELGVVLGRCATPVDLYSLASRVFISIQFQRASEYHLHTGHYPEPPTASTCRVEAR